MWFVFDHISNGRPMKLNFWCRSLYWILNLLIYREKKKKRHIYIVNKMKILDLFK